MVKRDERCTKKYFNMKRIDLNKEMFTRRDLSISKSKGVASNGSFFFCTKKWLIRMIDTISHIYQEKRIRLFPFLLFFLSPAKRRPHLNTSFLALSLLMNRAFLCVCQETSHERRYRCKEVDGVTNEKNSVFKYSIKIKEGCFVSWLAFDTFRFLWFLPSSLISSLNIFSFFSSYHYLSVYKYCCVKRRTKSP